VAKNRAQEAPPSDQAAYTQEHDWDIGAGQYRDESRFVETVVLRNGRKVNDSDLSAFLQASDAILRYV
jgi:hypothetical protein